MRSPTAARTYGFLDMVLRLGEGRDLATRKKAGEHIFKALVGLP